MTSTYNRTEFLTWDDLTKEQRIDVLHEDYDICDLALAEADTYAVIQREGQDGTPTAEALPLSFFMRSDRNPALGIYSTSAFDGFYLYIGRTGNEGVIAHRHF